MNYLAHIYLSGENPDIQVGGLLGDFIKGPLNGTYPALVETGIRLHRTIDSTTDSRPDFQACLATLPAPWRRFGGILLDVYFDHLLASRWPGFHRDSLEEFCALFYSHLQQRRDLLPPGATRFCDIAPGVKWLESYRNGNKIPLMLNNLGQRLRRPVALGDAWPELRARHDLLENCFDNLMNSHREFARHFLHQPIERQS